MRNVILSILPNLKEKDGAYGVEIEAEGNHLPVYDIDQLWRVETDDSLKAGYEAREYVMTEPASLDGVKKSLDYLKSRYVANNTKIYETQTSGVHVHINVQQFTAKELFTFMSLYFVLEELLLTYCGTNREGNHFCLRAKDAEWIVHETVKAAQEKNFKRLNTENLRYASLNPLSLFKYGSLESRAMRGTGDLDAIYTWVEIIDTVKRASLSFNTPIEVIEGVRNYGEVGFVKTILGDKAKFFTNRPDLSEMVRRGLRLMLPLAYTVDWSAYKDVNNNIFAKKL